MHINLMNAKYINKTIKIAVYDWLLFKWLICKFLPTYQSMLHIMAVNLQNLGVLWMVIEDLAVMCKSLSISRTLWGDK